jgi:hypothetical protein
MSVIPVLTPSTAVLTTASIEVAVLRLDRRQVTAAVFRQVPERSPIAVDGGLIEGAMPWGHVNYWWPGDGERNRYPHNKYSDPEYMAQLHLLWQLENNLYRVRLWGSSYYDLPGGSRYDAEGRVVGPSAIYEEKTFPMLASLPQLFIAA